jgi:peptidoglycan L-alanyl-D-glutamate endopeptidase CwlK
VPFGLVSRARLDECHPDLQRLVEDLAEQVDAGALAARGVEDLTVLCGFRGQAEQDAAFKRGASKLKWPRSKHNAKPARAVDIAPYPLDWKNTARFEALRELALKRASALGIRIRVISWDLPHFELL